MVKKMTNSIIKRILNNFNFDLRLRTTARLACGALASALASSGSSCSPLLWPVFLFFLNAGSLALHLEPREFHDGLAFQMSIAYEFSRPNSLFLPVCSIVLITPMCPGC
jgi:hypothetical protein